MGGLRRILFVAPDRTRKTIRLGKTPQRAAEAIKTKVEVLIALKVSGCPWDNETARWVAGLPDELADKLARVGLIPKRAGGKNETLGGFLGTYIAKRTDVKGGTRVFYGHTRRNLVDFFGADKPLLEITKGDADDFRRYLIKEGLSPATTVNRRCSLAKTFFSAAVRYELIDRNPFEELKGSVRGNRERMRFITRQVIEQVLEACPDCEWRLLVALARYGGLRVPSEALTIRWADVDWEHGKITVHSPKTEHHPDGASRVVPLFPELAPHLEEAWELAKPGTEYCISRWRHAAQKTPGGAELQSANPVPQDHPTGGHRALAEALAEPPVDKRNRAGRGVPRTCGLRLDRQQQVGGVGALFAGHRQPFPAGDPAGHRGGAQCGAVYGGIGS
ncbi:tyrosine-type recombinase/integrase [Planctomycetota bacterium]